MRTLWHIHCICEASLQYVFAYDVWHLFSLIRYYRTKCTCIVAFHTERDVHNPWIRSAQYYKSKLQWYKTLHILAHVLNSRICFCSSVRLSILCLNKVSRLLNLRSITLPIGEITILAVYLSSHTSSSSSSRVAMPSAYTHFHCITVAMLTKRTS